MSVLIPFLAVAITAGSASASQTLIWSDEFDGTSVDVSKWQVMDVADGTDSWFKPANVTVSSGTLKINSQEELYNGVHWTGGRLDGLYYPQYAYLEARVRITPADSYIWATWWTIGWQNNNSVWPPEFDIAEYYSTSRTMPSLSEAVASTATSTGRTKVCPFAGLVIVTLE